MADIRKENGERKTTKHYYILSESFNLDNFITITRQHWNIECSLHWKFDVIMDRYHLHRFLYTLGEKLTLKQKITRYTSDFKNIENLIFNVITYV